MSEEEKTKKKPWWLWLILIIVIAAAVFGYLYLNRTGPCGPEIYFTGTDFSNPQENYNSSTETTWMIFTFAGDELSRNHIFHYWWDTRAFKLADSFNKADGFCEVMAGSNQILCEGLTLSGLDKVTTDGYEYTLSLTYEDKKPECKLEGAVHSVTGLIHLDTLEHEIVWLKGIFLP